MAARIFIACSAAVAIAGLAACQQPGGRWEAGSGATDTDTLAVAQADCRSAAQAEAERTMPQRQVGSPSPSSSQPGDTSGQWVSMMDRFSAGRREQGLFERCMTQRGFRFVPNP
jgi:hypothetical protein